MCSRRNAQNRQTLVGMRGSFLGLDACPWIPAISSKRTGDRKGFLRCNDDARKGVRDGCSVCSVWRSRRRTFFCFCATVIGTEHGGIGTGGQRKGDLWGRCFTMTVRSRQERCTRVLDVGKGAIAVRLPTGVRMYDRTRGHDTSTHPLRNAPVFSLWFLNPNRTHTHGSTHEELLKGQVVGKRLFVV